MNKKKKTQFLRLRHLRASMLYSMLFVQYSVSRKKIPYNTAFNVFCLHNLFFRWKFSIGTFAFAVSLFCAHTVPVKNQKDRIHPLLHTDSASIKYTLALDFPVWEEQYDTVVVDLIIRFISRCKKTEFSGHWCSAWIFQRWTWCPRLIPFVSSSSLQLPYLPLSPVLLVSLSTPHKIFCPT